MLSYDRKLSRKLAPDLGTTEGKVKASIQHLPRHYRELLRGEIAQTVSGPAEIEEEIRFLRSALSISKHPL